MKNPADSRIPTFIRWRILAHIVLFHFCMLLWFVLSAMGVLRPDNGLFSAGSLFVLAAVTVSLYAAAQLSDLLFRRFSGCTCEEAAAVADYCESQKNYYAAKVSLPTLFALVGVVAAVCAGVALVYAAAAHFNLPHLRQALDSRWFVQAVFSLYMMQMFRLCAVFFSLAPPSDKAA